LADGSSRLKPGSQNALIVAALEANGGWMSTAQIHRAAGFSRLNSRISELREYGYEIPSRHVEGKQGPHSTQYMLMAAPRAERPQGTGLTSSSLDRAQESYLSSDAQSGRSAHSADIQLSIEEAAA
jgi:biotin operon repressor